MRFLAGIYILAALFALFQMRCSADEIVQRPNSKFLQKVFQNNSVAEVREYVQVLFEKFLFTFDDFYNKITTVFKCSEQNVTESIKEIILNSMKCIESIGRDSHLRSLRRTVQTCLHEGKIQVNNLLNTIDLKVNLCDPSNPNNTVRMNITKSLVTALKVNIDDGFEKEEKRLLCQKEEMNLKNDVRIPQGEMEDSGKWEKVEDGKGGNEMTTTTTPSPDDGEPMQKRALNPPDLRQERDVPDPVFGEIPYY